MSTAASTSDTDVMIFLPSLRGGGTERALVGIANGLHADGLRVTLVLARRQGPYLSEVAEGIETVDLDAARVLAAIPGLAREIVRRRPRALLSAMRHVNLTAILASLLARARGVRTRLVLSERASVLEERRRQGWWHARVLAVSCRLLYPMADAVVAVSAGVEAELRDEFRGALPDLRSIGNAVLTSKLAADLQRPVRHPWLSDSRTPVVLAAGRLVEEKGFDVLIAAFALLRASRPARLVILGEGPLEGALRARVSAAALEADVLFAGFDPCPATWMRDASLFVLSSRTEGLPNVLIQALASGTPVVSTDCNCGPAEILEQGRWGALVPVDDAMALAQAMARSLDAPRLPVPDEVLDRYRPHTIAALYRDVLRVATVMRLERAA